MLRGLVKLKKFKNLRKIRIGQTPPTHHLSIYFYFLKTCTTTTKNTKNITTFPRKKNPSCGLTKPLIPGETEPLN